MDDPIQAFGVLFKLYAFPFFLLKQLFYHDISQNHYPEVKNFRVQLVFLSRSEFCDSLCKIIFCKIQKSVLTSSSSSFLLLSTRCLKKRAQGIDVYFCEKLMRRGGDEWGDLREGVGIGCFDEELEAE